MCSSDYDFLTGGCPLSWIVIALISAAIIALVSISDKAVIYRYARSPLTLPLLIGMAQTTVGLIVLAIVRIPSGATLEASGSAVLSGALFGLSGVLGQRVLFTQEVSRTIPVVQSAPIFAALLAVVVLDESISVIQWLGIVATVLGSVFLSLRITAGIKSIILHRSFYLLMISAFMFGAANVAGKVALDELPVLYTHGLRMLALGLVFLMFSFRLAPLVDVRRFFSQRSPALLFVSTNEFITANVGILLLLWALSLGPASLVTALLGTRALFVVLYSTGLAIVWRGALGEETSPGIVAIKVFSTMLIVAGVVAIAL
jgi:uncharacterized membrane protein